MMIAHWIRLNPNDRQATYFARATGTARFAYNWAFDEWQRQYQAQKGAPLLLQPSQQSLRRQLEYKAWMHGGQIVVADRFFPSSKLCSVCGFKLDVLELSVRKWLC